MTHNEFSSSYDGFVGIQVDRFPPASHLLCYVRSMGVRRRRYCPSLNSRLLDMPPMTYYRNAAGITERLRRGIFVLGWIPKGGGMACFKRDTSTMLFDRLVKQGAKCLDLLTTGMMREGGDASYMQGEDSQFGVLNGALEEMRRQRS
mmetsp:Transcript_12337/g.26808  ORF Transcript_12337/g.26808 Transcript_12337/m.26808 type:complete len:147 (-) Transcript_12337:8-448(-)